MAESAAEPAVSEDRLLEGQVRLLQPRKGHRAGTDAVLLAGLAEPRGGDRVVDLGSGSGAVGLLIAARCRSAALTFVERDTWLVALCRRNIDLNGFADRAAALEADVFAAPAERHAAGLQTGECDLVVTNPPFLDARARPSPEPRRRSAHSMEGGGLDEWLRCAWDLLKPRGRLCMIHRADRLDACFDALRPGFGSFAVRPIHPREDAVASRVVIKAVKGGRSPLVLHPPLVLHEADGGFTPAARDLHGTGGDASAG